MYQLEHQKMVDSLAIVKVKMPSLLLKLQVSVFDRIKPKIVADSWSLIRVHE